METLGKTTGNLQKIIDSLPMGVLGLDAEGHCLSINDSAQNTLAISEATAVGKPILDIIEDPTLRLIIEEAIDESRSDRPYSREFSTKGLHYDLRATVVREDALDADHIVVLFEDVSQKKHAASKKDEFLALISHELRTPLTVIKGYLEIIQTGMMGDISSKQRECVDIMHDHCNQLEILIRDLIRFGMLTRGELRVAPETITLFPFLKLFTRAQKKRLQQARMTLSIIVPDPSITCLCDAEHLKDALRHLIDNAIKFGPPGTSIQLCATEFDPATLPDAEKRIIRDFPTTPQKWVRVDVVDTGPGIPADRVRDLFNSFEQMENYMTRKSRGLGLGLALVKEIIRAYGGSLWIDSVEGEGTTVAFILPRINRKYI